MIVMVIVNIRYGMSSVCDVDGVELGGQCELLLDLGLKGVDVGDNAAANPEVVSGNKAMCFQVTDRSKSGAAWRQSPLLLDLRAGTRISAPQCLGETRANPGTAEPERSRGKDVFST